MESNIPTGLGLTRGMEAMQAVPGGTSDRPAKSAANNAKYSTFDQQPDPCYCGKCDLTRKPFN